MINKYPELSKNIFLVEQALEKAFSKNFLSLYKKNEFDFQKTLAMCKNGYFKNVDREINDIEWNKILFHYFFLVENYVDSDFDYQSFVAINDIANFDIEYIKLVIRKINVKNIYYLRKVLLEEKKINQEYKIIEDKCYMNSVRGKVIKYEGLISSEKYRYN